MSKWDMSLGGGRKGVKIWFLKDSQIGISYEKEFWYVVTSRMRLALTFGVTPNKVKVTSDHNREIKKRFPNNMCV